MPAESDVAARLRKERSPGAHLFKLFAALLLTVTAACDRKPEPAAQTQPQEAAAPSSPAAPAQDLATARKGFVSKLTVRGPAPQEYEEAAPPAGVKEVAFASGDLKLKGWLSADAKDGKKRPAVVFLHGGWSFGEGDWDDAAPFVAAGYVLFMPMLRGENGNPGIYESFLGEVDDAIAAGRFVAAMPNVDRGKVFVAGHSVGATLTALACLLPSPFKGGAALEGPMEMGDLLLPVTHVPYPPEPGEILVRNPMPFAATLQCPLRLYIGKLERKANERLAAKAKKAGKDCEVVNVPGNHQTMVAPAVKHAIGWFRELAEK